MLIHECKPTITAQGNLRFMIPGFNKTLCEITPWSAGFDTYCIKNGFTVESHMWSLNLLAEQRARPLPVEVRDFIADIPAQIRKRVRGYEFAQCMLLKCLAKYPEADDLNRSNPHLLWLLLAAIFDSRIDADTIERCCRKRQLELLARLVRDPAKAKLKLLRKVELRSGSLGEARTLLDALAKPYVCEVTAHEPTVPLELLTMLVHCPGLANPAIVRLLAEQVRTSDSEPAWDAPRLESEVKDIGRLARTLRIERPQQALERCKSLEDVTRLHDRWIDRMNEELADMGVPAMRFRRDGELERGANAADGPWRRGLGSARRVELTQIRALTFPPPPLPDTADIRAITTADELAKEGFEQKHCVGTYARRVAADRIYVYRLLRPERATFELKKDGDGWVLGQFRLARNARPGNAAKERVERWLAEHTTMAVPSIRTETCS